MADDLARSLQERYGIVVAGTYLPHFALSQRKRKGKWRHASRTQLPTSSGWA